MERKAVARVHSAPARGGFVHRQATGPQLARHPLQDLQRSVGSRAVQRLINSPYIQTKLNDSPPGDQEVEESLLMAEDGMRMGVAVGPSQDAPDPLKKKCPTCEASHDHCPKCAADNGIPEPDPPVPAAPGPPEASPAVPAQSPPPPPPAVRTFTFISRGSYGQTTATFTPPSCAAGAAPGSSIMVAGSVATNVTVFPTGTYRVRRDDGVVQTATCTRLPAGLAATRVHEGSHVAGVRAGVVAANTAAGLPQNFATAALCAAALPGVVGTWTASTNAVARNEATHGPGTNPPTPQTFAEEHAAGNCTFV